MITVEELKVQFGVRNILGHGACIVIPKGKFNVDWEKPLKEQNVDIEFNVDLPGGDRCTVLKLKPQHLGERVVFEPEKPKRKHKLVGPFVDPSLRWLPEEDDVIISLWNKGIPVAGITSAVCERFPKRTKSSVKNRIQRLQKAGKIEYRFATNRKKTREKLIKPPFVAAAPAGPEPATPQPASTPVHTPVPFSINTTLTIQLSVNCNDRNAVANLFEVIEKMGLGKKEASA
jgi:hypothetical protein